MQICSKCNGINYDGDVVCKHCEAELIVNPKKEIKRGQVNKFFLIPLILILLPCIFPSIQPTYFSFLIAVGIGVSPWLILLFCYNLWKVKQDKIKKQQQEEIKSRQKILDAEQRERERQQREREELNRHRERERQQKEDAKKREELRRRRDRDGDKTSYEILGVSTNATAEEIRKAYKKKALENHPDRMAGLGDEYRRLAEKRMKEINAAYEKLRKR